MEPVGSYENSDNFLQADAARQPTAAAESRSAWRIRMCTRAKPKKQSSQTYATRGRTTVISKYTILSLNEKMINYYRIQIIFLEPSGLLQLMVPNPIRQTGPRP